MKKLATMAAIAFGLAATTAVAADMKVKAKPKEPETPTWDIAFGGALMNDYMFRGISQSAHRPSVYAYSELRWNPTKELQFYYGNSGESIDYPNHAAAEVDFYGGFRYTVQKLTLDFGFWYYYYPGGVEFNGLGPSPATCTNLSFTPTGFCNAQKGNLSYWEVYAKPTFKASDEVLLGANVYYSPSWLNSGAYGVFASGTGKFTFPSKMFPKDFGAYVSAELGYYWFGTTDAFYATPAFPAGIKYPDYAHWNIGLALTYKVFTLDLRYHDTNLSRADCNVLGSDQTAGFDPGSISLTNPSGLASRWCGSTFVAKFSADLTLNDNVK